MSPSALAACDDFEAVCTDVRANRVRRADQSMAVTLAAVKAAVAQRVSATSGAGDGVGGVNKVRSFIRLSMQKLTRDHLTCVCDATLEQHFD